MLAFPYAEGTPLESHLFSALGSVVVLASLFCVADTALQRSIGLVLAGPAVACDWIATARGASLLVPIGLAFEAAFFALVAGVVFGAVFRARNVSADHLAGSVCVYLLVGVAFASLFTAIDVGDPGAFRGSGEGSAGQPWAEYLFFSFTALTTVGYGDITPATSITRSLATVETVFGVLYVAILVARLVGVYASRSHESP